MREKITILIIVCLTFGLFVLWRVNVQKTKRVQELTQQLKTIYEHPKIVYKEGPARVVQGPVRIVEKVVIQRSSETITSETVVEMSTMTVERGEASFTSEPIVTPALVKREGLRPVLCAGYVFSDEVFVGAGVSYKRLTLVLALRHQTRKKEYSPSIFVLWRF